MAELPKGNPAARSHSEEDNSLVLTRLRLRKAVELHPDWTHEAIAAAMREKGVPMDGPYFSKMLAGDKPINLKQIDALPDEIEATYYRLQAESFGLLVVERVDAATAQRQLASGLFNLLTGPLPAKATAMARAALPIKKRAVNE